MPPQNGKLKLRDIARLTGHTVGTVSKALHDKPGLAPKTREYILKVARENGYIGNALAGSLRSGTTKTAAIILGDIANPLFSIMAKGLIAALARVGYSAILLNSEEDSEEEVRAVTTALSRNVDGVFLCPTQRSMEGVKLLRAQRRALRARWPAIFRMTNLDSVVFDDLNGGRLAARHLLSLGHRDVLFLGGPECVSSARERREGFMAEIEAAGAIRARLRSADHRRCLPKHRTGDLAGAGRHRRVRLFGLRRLAGALRLLRARRARAGGRSRHRL